MEKLWAQTEDQVLDELAAQQHKEQVTLGCKEPTDWHAAFHGPYKVVCGCEWPHVARSGSQALGLVLDIDLCCLAKAVEELTGKRFYRLTQTEPVFEWDDDKLVPDERDFSGQTLRRLGPPPPFMLRRLEVQRHA